MYVNQKSGRFILLACVLVVSGCTSFLQGKQYIVPGADDPAATVRLKTGGGARLDAMTFSDNGCYAGYTTLPSNGDHIESRVAANKELILTYWKITAALVRSRSPSRHRMEPPTPWSRAPGANLRQAFFLSSTATSISAG